MICEAPSHVITMKQVDVAKLYLLQRPRALGVRGFLYERDCSATYSFMEDGRSSRAALADGSDSKPRSEQGAISPSRVVL